MALIKCGAFAISLEGVQPVQWIEQQKQLNATLKQEDSSPVC